MAPHPNTAPVGEELEKLKAELQPVLGQIILAHSSECRVQFVCAKCDRICLEHQLNRYCGHLCCLICLTEAEDKCPSCFKRADLMMVDSYIEEHVMYLKVYCKYKGRFKGCTEIVNLWQYPAHVKDCIHKVEAFSIGMGNWKDIEKRPFRVKPSPEALRWLTYMQSPALVNFINMETNEELLS